MKRRLRLQAVAVLIALLMAVPICLILAGLLLPEDPDDPNTKAMILGLVAMLPFGAAAAGAYVLAIRVLAAEGRGARARLHGLLRTTTPIAVAGLMLLLAWLVAYETPQPETPEQSAASPYLWRDGAVRVAVAALLLLITSAALSLAGGRRQPEDEPEPAGKAPLAG